MNFFKSIFSDDPESPEHENPHESDSKNPPVQKNDNDDDVDYNSSNVWGFEGLIKSLATRSESVIETYRKDLQEFGSGLKKETEVLREVANRAVKDLPTTIEASASAARDVLKSTAEIISKETSLFAEPETNQSLSSGRYSWFDSQLSAMQGDMNTYCNEPEDVEEYEKWKLGFVLGEKRDEIEGLIGENGYLDDVYKRAVPSVVDNETFWCRYFYKVDKLEQQERVRANLVKRAISVDDDEDFSWDVEDEDEGANENEVQSGVVEMKGGDVVGDKKVASEESPIPADTREESSSGPRNDEKEKSNPNVDGGNNNIGVEDLSRSSENVSLGAKEVVSKEVAEVKSDEKMNSEESVEKKNDEKVREEDKGESGTRNDAAVGSSKQAKVENEELEWDEIEDVGSGDEKKSAAAGSTGISNRAYLRKRLSVEEDDEDLNWDIEDDDEPLKA